MAGNKVTIQDIADELGLSRNTVSKAINNTGILADATKEKILQKAMDMGYKTFNYINPQSEQQFSSQSVIIPKLSDIPQREIALFTGMFLDNSHFASTMLDKLQCELSLLGFSMSIHRVMPNNLNDLTLPLSFRKENVAAVLCIEIFNYAYCEMICNLGLPILLVDAPVATYAKPLPADILLMENTSAFYQIIQNAQNAGISKIGYIGEATHCRSFHERYMAFRDAMHLYSLPIEEKFCLTEIHPHGIEYRDHLRQYISNMKEFPELFICVNDFIAIDALIIFRELGISCPDNILLCGFDDSPESKITSPSLTTCHIHSQIMGFSAAQLLFSRLQQKDLHYRTVHTETNLIFRDSTGKDFKHA